MASLADEGSTSSPAANRGHRGRLPGAPAGAAGLAARRPRRAAGDARRTAARRAEDPAGLIEALARDAEPGLVGTAGPRYFGFVVGGGVPAALAADWLTSAWDQNAGLYALSPAAAVAEEVAARWLVDLFGLPAGSSVGFATGRDDGHVHGARGRRAIACSSAPAGTSRRTGYVGAPPIEVVVGDEAHVTIFVSLQMLGLGRARVHRVAADEQGRMRAGRAARDARRPRRADRSSAPSPAT